MENKYQKIPAKKSRYAWKGLVIRLVILILLAIFSIAGFFVYKIYKLEKKIIQITPIEETAKNIAEKSTLGETAKNLVTLQKKTLQGEERERINILLLGMGGEGHSGKYLTDTIILASINPKTYQSSLLSIPRDLYVKIPDSYIHTKINAVYTYELRYQEKDPGYSMASLKKLISEITGQTVDYYIALDFEGFQKIINELGGIDVEVENDILDTRYPGPNFSYQTFQINKGFHHLDGETALKYARVRHTAGGDFGRARRQQQVLASAKKKAFSIESFVNLGRLNNLINILGESLKTDVHLSEIPRFLELTEKINIYQTTNKVLDAWSPDSLLASSHVPLGGVTAYVLLPRANNYSQIHELAENIFDLENIERKKQEIENENASIFVATMDYNNFYKIKNILNKFGYKKIKLEKNTEIASGCRTENKIYNNSDSAKLFTIDDLASKFQAGVEDRQIRIGDNRLSEDIVVCLSEDAVKYFDKQNEKEEDENAELKEQSIINTDGNLLFNKEN